MTEMRIDGKTALVTGAAGGLGVTDSRTLAEAGAKVVMLDIDEEGGQKAADEINTSLAGSATPVTFVRCDLNDLQAAQALVKDLGAKNGGFDILINNAALIPLGPIEEISIEEYEKVMRINAHAAFALAQAVVPGMKANKDGRIVNMCSVTLSGGWKDFVPYVSSKGTLLGFTRSLARELGPWNIRVNAISPGAIPTEAEARVWADQLESYRKFILDHQSLKFRGDPQDIADAILFLVSDKSRFITGQNLLIDGGWYMDV